MIPFIRMEKRFSAKKNSVNLLNFVRKNLLGERCVIITFKIIARGELKSKVGQNRQKSTNVR